MLPRRYTIVINFTPATSGVIEHSFTEAESSIIMENGKKLQLTSNNVLPVLEQVARYVDVISREILMLKSGSSGKEN